VGEDDEDKICHMCPTTEHENSGPPVWVDWMAASVCGECAHFFGIGVDDAA
jgi:hypothetical protein